MPFFKSLPANAAPPTVYQRYPEIYAHWSRMSEALMNGPSPIGRSERELIFSYAAAMMGCEFVHVAHSEVAYALGVERGLVERLADDPDAIAGCGRLAPLLHYVRKLAQTPPTVTQADADAVFAAGWDEQALHDAIAVTARASFMHRLVQGHGFAPLTREVAAAHAQRRIERGYVNLYPALRDKA